MDLEETMLLYYAVAEALVVISSTGRVAVVTPDVGHFVEVVGEIFEADVEITGPLDEGN